MKDDMITSTGDHWLLYYWNQIVFCGLALVCDEKKDW